MANTSTSESIGKYTFVLMPRRRDFTRGMADILDFSNLENRYAMSETEQEADTKAIAADWKAVGHDIEIAYARGKQEIARQ